METQDLFQGESILLTSNDKTVVLTNRRIRQQRSSLGRAYLVTLQLNHISSIECRYRSSTIPLILGIILLILSLYSGSQQADSNITITSFIAGIVCILFYLITRRHLITISSDGGARMFISIRGMGQERALKFINKIEEAKDLIE